jgi:hypothetical protein
VRLVERNGIALERGPAGVRIESVWTGAAIELGADDARWLQAVALPALLADEPSAGSPRDSSLPSCESS